MTSVEPGSLCCSGVANQEIQLHCSHHASQQLFTRGLSLDGYKGGHHQEDPSFSVPGSAIKWPDCHEDEGVLPSSANHYWACNLYYSFASRDFYVVHTSCTAEVQVGVEIRYMSVLVTCDIKASGALVHCITSALHNLCTLETS